MRRFVKRNMNHQRKINSLNDLAMVRKEWETLAEDVSMGSIRCAVCCSKSRQEVHLIGEAGYVCQDCWTFKKRCSCGSNLPVCKESAYKKCRPCIVMIDKEVEIQQMTYPMGLSVISK